MNTPPIKQFIIIRKDLNMRKGKIAAQAAHASMKVFFDMMKENIKNNDNSMEMTLKVTNPFMKDWIMGNFTKIGLSVNSEDELLAIYNQAKEAGLPCSLILDAGLTEFDGPTYTAVAIGPDELSKITPITSKLSLF